MKTKVMSVWKISACGLIVLALLLQAIALASSAVGFLGILTGIFVLAWLVVSVLVFKFQKRIKIGIYCIGSVSVICSLFTACREGAMYLWIICFLLLFAAGIQVVCLGGSRFDLSGEKGKISAGRAPRIFTLVSTLFLLAAIMLMALPFSSAMPFAPGPGQLSIHRESWFNLPFLFSYADFFTIAAAITAVIWLGLSILLGGFHKSTESGILVLGSISTISSIISVFFWNIVSAWGIAICLLLLASLAIQVIGMCKASRRKG